jgi:hypothetical protein
MRFPGLRAPHSLRILSFSPLGTVPVPMTLTSNSIYGFHQGVRPQLLMIRPIGFFIGGIPPAWFFHPHWHRQGLVYPLFSCRLRHRLLGTPQSGTYPAIRVAPSQPPQKRSCFLPPVGVSPSPSLPFKKESFPTTLYRVSGACQTPACEWHLKDHRGCHGYNISMQF